ncbi:MAG: hypothetical protein RLZZ339_1117 [Cyanobacteriota bacterium]|jgi:hypothetical protein
MLSKLLSKAVQKAQELPEAIQDELAEQFKTSKMKSNGKKHYLNPKTA